MWTSETKGLSKGKTIAEHLSLKASKYPFGFISISDFHFS